MTQVKMTNFPDLMGMLHERQRQVHRVRMNRNMTASQSQHILGFWQEIAERLQDEDNFRTMGGMVGELDSDINMLRALKQSLEMTSQNPEQANQLLQIVKLLMMLLDISEKLKRWYRHLKDQHFAYIMSINPATPSKAKQKKDDKKDKKKAKKAKSKKVVEESKVEPKKKEPSKKMSA
jgi:hypothetical protein